MQYPKRTVTHGDQQIELAIAPMEDTSPRFSGVGDFIICGYVTTQRHKVQSFEAVVEVHQLNEDDTTTRRSIEGSDLVFNLETALCRMVGLIDHEYQKLQDGLTPFEQQVGCNPIIKLTEKGMRHFAA